MQAHPQEVFRDLMAREPKSLRRKRYQQAMVPIKRHLSAGRVTVASLYVISAASLSLAGGWWWIGSVWFIGVGVAVAFIYGSGVNQ